MRINNLFIPKFYSARCGLKGLLNIKNNFWVASLIIFLFVGSYKTAVASTAQKVYASSSPSVVVIVSLNEDGDPFGSGSGVVVGKNKVITNWHVIKDAHSIIVRQSGTNYHSSILSDRRDRDLALLNVEGLNAPAVKLGNEKSLKVGQQVFAIGAPSGLELTLTNGLVSALREVKDGKVIQTSAPISPGSSGGGLFDEEGNLIGITTLKLVGEAQEGLGFAMPVEWVIELSSVKNGPGLGGSKIWIFLLFFIGMLALAPKAIRAITARLADASYVGNTVEQHSNEERPEVSGDEVSYPISSSESSKYEALVRLELKKGKIDEELMKKSRLIAGDDEGKVERIYISLRSDQMSERRRSEENSVKKEVIEDAKNKAASPFLKINSSVIASVAAVLLVSGLFIYLMVQKSPPVGSLAYKTQFFVLKVSESAYDKRDLFVVAERYRKEGGTKKAVEILNYLDAEKFPEAQHRLGEIHLEGEGVSKDVDKGIEYFEKASKGNHYDATLKLFDIYSSGKHVKADDEKAFNYLIQSANQGNPTAYGYLSNIYLNALGVQVNYSESYKWAQLGAEKNDALSQHNLGLLLYYGYGVPANKSLGVSYLEKAAQGNFPKTLLVLSKIYTSDEQLKDLDKARLYLQKSAKIDDPEALYEMGMAYTKGGVQHEDYIKSIEFFIRSCNMGYRDSCYQMGLAYLYGIGVAKDPSEGVRWIKKAANEGSTSAMFDLATIFKVGVGDVLKNEREFFLWMLKAGMKGHVRAYQELGFSYFGGEGVAQDFVEARRWFELASEKGYYTSQAMLSQIYLYGLGVSTDYQKGRVYAERSAAGGAPRGKYMLGIVHLFGYGVPHNEKYGLDLIAESFYGGQYGAASTLSSYYTRKINPYTSSFTNDSIMAWAWTYAYANISGENFSTRLDSIARGGHLSLSSSEVKKAKSIGDQLIARFKNKNS